MNAAPQVVETHDLGFVRVITLARPHRMNAIDLDLACALRDAVQSAVTDPHVRALVITGARGNFCTGGDIRRDRDREMKAGINLVEVVGDVFLALRHGDKPSVAAVEGHARGAGLSLMLACDFAVAGGGARFAAQFTRMGLTPDLGLAVTLPERIGMAGARKMILCGTEQDAQDALAGGLIDEVAPAGEALSAALALAGTIAAGAPLATAAARRLLNMSRASVEQVLREEVQLQTSLQATEDAREAMNAFSEKRTPVFRGR